MVQVTWESIKGDAETILSKLKELIHEGNVRCVIVKHKGRTVAEFPLTAGVIAAVVAPVLAAVGAIVALLKDCSIEVQRDEDDQTTRSEPTGRPAPPAT
jgi:hypothetical protein